MLKCFPGFKEAQNPAWGHSIALAVPAISVLQELCPHWLGGAHGVTCSHLGWAGAGQELCASSAPGWSKHHDEPTALIWHKLQRNDQGCSQDHAWPEHWDH